MGKGYRQERLGEEIRKLISSMILRELKDPGLMRSMISITAVDVTRDCGYATCYITVLDISKDHAKAVSKKREVLDSFEKAKNLIRREIGKQIKLKHVPELIFKMDESMEYGRHIEDVLKSLEKDDE